MAQVVRTFYKEDEKAETPGMKRHEARRKLNMELREKQSTPSQKVGRAINATRGFLAGSLTKVRAAAGPAVEKVQKFASEHPANVPGAHKHISGIGGVPGRGSGPDFGFKPDFGAFGATMPTGDPRDDFKKKRRPKRGRTFRSKDDYMDYLSRF